MRYVFAHAVIGAAALLGFGLCGASAQTYGVDYLAFQGTGVILDNPTSATCQTKNFNFGSTFTI